MTHDATYEEPAVETQSVTFRYGDRPVLDGVTLKIAPTEILGVIGPNGSGKTTLLNVLSRTLRPERGRVRLFGRDMDSMSPREIAQTVAVVPQSSPVAFPFTVGEIVLMGRSPYQRGISFETAEDRRIAAAAMEATDTLDFANRRITELSGGETQRAIIARALAQQPRVLLLDEPTAHLDLHHQISIYEILARLNANHEMTVVVVSHDLNLAAVHCDRLVLFAHGSIAADGPPAEVITEDNINRIYGVNVPVIKPAVMTYPMVVPVRTGEPSESKQNYRKSSLT